jgi:hypothetical protein
LVAAGAGVLAGGFAAYEASHGKSLQNKANDAARARGGAYSQADLGDLNSGASALHTGNAFLVGAGALLLGGGVFYFAF